MAIPSAPLQLCLLVDYGPDGTIVANGQRPVIAVLARISNTDAASTGILMRVEVCNGLGCTNFAVVGNVTALLYASTQPQFQFMYLANQFQPYRIRVRFENSDGVGPYSTILDINTNAQGNTACDTGVVSDFIQQIQAGSLTEIIESNVDRVIVPGLTEIIESDVNRVIVYALTVFIETQGNPLAAPGTPTPGTSGPTVGPDPDRFTGDGPPPYVDGSGNKNVFIYYGHQFELTKDPLDVTRMDSYELDFGWNRWKFIRRIWWAGISSGPITMEIWIDETLRFTTTFSMTPVSGTGWSKAEIRLPAECLKGQLFRFILTSDSAFKIFLDQSQIEWKPLSSDRAYERYTLDISHIHDR